MAATAGRILCAKCGANNFDTQASCWKCSAPLAAGPASSQPSPLASRPAAHHAQPTSPPPDPIVAVISSICLAIFFPLIAVPVGFVFLMLDDRRKIEIGRITLIAGIISTLIQFLFTFWLMQATIRQSMGLMQNLIGGRAAAMGEADPDSALPPMATRPRIQIDPSSVSTPPPTDNVPFPEPPNLSGSSH